MDSWMIGVCSIATFMSAQQPARSLTEAMTLHNIRLVLKELRLKSGREQVAEAAGSRNKKDSLKSDRFQPPSVCAGFTQTFTSLKKLLSGSYISWYPLCSSFKYGGVVCYNVAQAFCNLWSCLNLHFT